MPLRLRSTLPVQRFDDAVSGFRSRGSSSLLSAYRQHQHRYCGQYRGHLPATRDQRDPAQPNNSGSRFYRFCRFFCSSSACSNNSARPPPPCGPLRKRPNRGCGLLGGIGVLGALG
ncbi:hypothetical protein NDU88_002277 [Pleurodeles waltl]|uniref:Uncharacterized protein n=1 Tax=Pleurodeles waltl TaxID=8319 RepID=A0AAV7S9Y8_PLEWA|nr:hypothetical protein NDU88_002277 [Pleurodeles waltl]